MLLDLISKNVVPIFAWMSLLTYFCCIAHPSAFWKQVVSSTVSLPVFMLVCAPFRTMPYSEHFPVQTIIVFVIGFLFLQFGTGWSLKANLYLATHVFMWTQVTLALSYALVFSTMTDHLGDSKMSAMVVICIGVVLNVIGIIIEGVAFNGNTLVRVTWYSILIAYALTILGCVVANLTTKTSLELFSEVDPSTFASMRQAFYLRTLTLLFAGSLLYLEQIYRRNLALGRISRNLESVASNQSQEYQRSHENLEEIHRLSHDMKHYLMVLSQPAPTSPANMAAAGGVAEGDVSGAGAGATGAGGAGARTLLTEEERAQLLEQLRTSVDNTSALQLSGNAVLDAIINEKRDLCAKLGVHLVVMADGTALSRLQTLDLTSLVGNLLDNAIEACSKLPNEGQRIIHFDVRRKNGFAVLHVDNCFDPSTLHRDSDGNLETSKTEDVENHGHGVRSIKVIAQKYDGNATPSVDRKHNVFNMNVIIPLKDTNVPDRPNMVAGY